MPCGSCIWCHFLQHLFFKFWQFCCRCTCPPHPSHLFSTTKPIWKQSCTTYGWKWRIPLSWFQVNGNRTTVYTVYTYSSTTLFHYLVLSVLLKSVLKLGFCSKNFTKIAIKRNILSKDTVHKLIEHLLIIHINSCGAYIISNSYISSCSTTFAQTNTILSCLHT